MNRLKRSFDLIIALLLLGLLGPILIIIALVNRYQLGAPIFFRQVRPGLQARPFCMIKFRTMLNTTDQHNQLLTDELRVTRYGQFLRGTSLDELPELWNVVKGDMSLVGPRPLLMEYLPLYNEAQKKRHTIKPGITGWAQINGRNAVSWPEKFKLDEWYVNNQSLMLDIKILWLTIKQVLLRRGINNPGKNTTEKFLGNP